MRLDKQKPPLTSGLFNRRKEAGCRNQAQGQQKNRPALRAV
jgi:hypothetical protein